MIPILRATQDLNPSIVEPSMIGLESLEEQAAIGTVTGGLDKVCQYQDIVLFFVVEA